MIGTWTAARLAPYGIAAAVLLALGFAAGYRWQAGEVADAEKAQAAAEADRDAWQAAAGKWEDATGRWQARYAADEAEARRQKAEAARQLALLEQEEERARRAAADWKARFNAARRDPDCAALMEETSCPVFSDY